MGTFFRFGWWELGSQANMQLLWPWPTGNRFDIWQEMKAIVLQSYNWNFVHSENFTQNEIAWMRNMNRKET